MRIAIVWLQRVKPLMSASVFTIECICHLQSTGMCMLHAITNGWFSFTFPSSFAIRSPFRIRTEGQRASVGLRHSILPCSTLSFACVLTIITQRLFESFGISLWESGYSESIVFRFFSSFRTWIWILLLWNNRIYCRTYFCSSSICCPMMGWKRRSSGFKRKLWKSWVDLISFQQ